MIFLLLQKLWQHILYIILKQHNTPKLFVKQTEENTNWYLNSYVGKFVRQETVREVGRVTGVAIPMVNLEVEDKERVRE